MSLEDWTGEQTDQSVVKSLKLWPGESTFQLLRCLILVTMLSVSSEVKLLRFGWDNEMQGCSPCGQHKHRHFILQFPSSSLRTLAYSFPVFFFFLIFKLLDQVLIYFPGQLYCLSSSLWVRAGLLRSFAWKFCVILGSGKCCLRFP